MAPPSTFRLAATGLPGEKALLLDRPPIVTTVLLAGLGEIHSFCWARPTRRARGGPPESHSPPVHGAQPSESRARGWTRSAHLLWVGRAVSPAPVGKNHLSPQQHDVQRLGRSLFQAWFRGGFAGSSGQEGGLPENHRKRRSWAWVLPPVNPQFPAHEAEGRRRAGQVCSPGARTPVSSPRPRAATRGRRTRRGSCASSSLAPRAVGRLAGVRAALSLLSPQPIKAVDTPRGWGAGGGGDSVR